jgi:hypothetical protein
MHVLPLLTLPPIVAVDGRNLLENARLALHLSLHLCADRMEKLLQPSQLAVQSKDLAVNLDDYMQPQLLQQPLA